jgi:hypothetical protein
MLLLTSSNALLWIIIKKSIILGFRITAFRIIWTSNRHKHFQKQLISSKQAIEWCMNCHIWMKKNFSQFSP